MKKLITMMLSAVLAFCLAVMPAAAQGAGVPAPVDNAQPVAAAAITVDDLKELLISCTGYAGTAGSSLKGAGRAEGVLDYCLNNQLAQTDRAAFAQALSAAHALLTDAQREELIENMEYIFEVLDAAFTDYLSVEGLFDAAGVEDTIKPLLKTENAYKHYSAFKLAMLSVFGKFEELLISCTGYAGTAGSSLKNVIAAYGVLKFCAENRMAYADPAALAEMLSAAYGSLCEDRAQELAWNMESISGLIEDAFTDYESVEELIDSAGVAEDMQLLLETEGVYGDWAAFCLQMQSVLGAIGE